jgi:hypothetical protein
VSPGNGTPHRFDRACLHFACARNEPPARHALITRGIAIAEQYLGMAALAEKLRAHPDMIRDWRDGHATMPELKVPSPRRHPHQPRSEPARQRSK